MSIFLGLAPQEVWMSIANRKLPLRVLQVEGDDEEIAGGAEVVSVAGILLYGIPQMEAANNAATRQVGDETRT